MTPEQMEELRLEYERIGERMRELAEKATDLEKRMFDVLKEIMKQEDNEKIEEIRKNILGG
ncbi:TPA: hypothetical protein DD617_00480 [Candidatus Uhrbacteria bacterium]|jgi:hypothetical protein|nr:hypothetical protein [Candidatus Uhrbacteria bacterium]